MMRMCIHESNYTSGSIANWEYSLYKSQLKDRVVLFRKYFLAVLHWHYLHYLDTTQAAFTGFRYLELNKEIMQILYYKNIINLHVEWN